MRRVVVESARTAEERERAGRRAAEVLADGGVVVHPTETVYGIGGDGSAATNRLIARIKGRAADRPLILLTPDLAALREFLPGLSWPDVADRLARRFWPGALTMIVPCPDAPRGLRGPGGGVAVRVSPHPVVAAIFRHWPRPMTSTSANPSGSEPAEDVGDAVRLLQERSADLGSRAPALALDVGPLRGGRPSTIVDLVAAPPRLVREGPVDRAAIAELVPELREPGR